MHFSNMEAFEREREVERAACDLALEEKESEWETKTGGKYSPKHKRKDTRNKSSSIEDKDNNDDNQEENVELTPFAKELYELNVKMRSKEEAWSNALRNTEELLDIETEKLRECEKECNHLV